MKFRSTVRRLACNYFEDQMLTVVVDEFWIMILKIQIFTNVSVEVRLSGNCARVLDATTTLRVNQANT